MATAEFLSFAVIFNTALSQHHLLGFETAQPGFHHLQLAFFVVMLPKVHLLAGPLWALTFLILKGDD